MNLGMRRVLEGVSEVGSRKKEGSESDDGGEIDEVEDGRGRSEQNSRGGEREKSDQGIEVESEIMEDNTAGDERMDDNTFTMEQVELFEKRLANGYDLYVDDDYVRWLKQNHPQSLPDELRIGATISIHSTPIALSKNLSPHHEVALTPTPHSSSDPLEGPSRLLTDSDSPMSGNSFRSSFRSTRKTFSEISNFLSIPSSVVKRSVNERKSPFLVLEY